MAALGDDDPTSKGLLLSRTAVQAKIDRMREMGDDALFAESALRLHDTYHSLHDSMNEWLAKSRLTLAKFDLLTLLKHGAPDQQLPMAEIGARMCVTGANVTGLVDGLERQGLVRRANMPGDRRVVLAQLTAEGEALVDEILPQHHQHMRAMWSGLNPVEIRQLIHLLTKLQGSIDHAENQSEAISPISK